MNILVVDDKQSVLNSLTILLESEGHNVTTANNGLDGFEKAQKSFYDLFIIDHLMPIMNGLQLSKNLNQHENYSSHPIIFMTTQDVDTIVNSSEANLFTAIVSKPIDENHLIKLISPLNNKNIQLISL